MSCFVFFHFLWPIKRDCFARKQEGLFLSAHPRAGIAHHGAETEGDAHCRAGIAHHGAEAEELLMAEQALLTVEQKLKGSLTFPGMKLCC